MKRLSLNGTWKVAFRNLDAKIIIGKPGARKTEWYEARVPGDVHLDMMNAGLIEDPFFGRNADHCLWMETKDWWYRKIFRIPETFSGKTLFLRFSGLDAFATVFFNGEVVGTHDNMFTPLEIDVTRRVKTADENELLVKLAAPLYAVTPSAKTGAFDPLIVYSRKAAMSYGWDIAPRLLTIGIWKDVELLAFDEARITDVHIFTGELSATAATVVCEVTIRKEVPGKTALELTAAVGTALGRMRIQQDVEEQTHRLSVPVQNPRLWWPNGYGPQNLYRCNISLTKNRKVLDTRHLQHGIRTVELVQEPQGEQATSFYFRVNGKPIFVKGFNWSPPDAIFARPDAATYRKLLGLVKECHANMLRVAGVGIYEKDPFYELCDKLGILVWQDFMLNGLMYPQEDAGFVRNLQEEVAHVVKHLRSHPCIALWCGDNEGDLKWTNWDGSHHYFNRITREIIPTVVREFDAIRLYLPSCPCSPSLETDPHDRLSGDRHQYMHGADYRHPDFMQNPACPRFLSETGYISCPDRDVLRQFLRADEFWPTDNKTWWYHSSDTRFIGSRYRIAALHDGIRNNGKPAPGTIDDFIRSTQEVQAEALVTWIETAAAHPECGGILFWNFCDCWPQISDSVVAYPCKPKLAYRALKKAFARIKR